MPGQESTLFAQLPEGKVHEVTRQGTRPSQRSSISAIIGASCDGDLFDRCYGDPVRCYGGRPRTLRRSPPDVTEVASNGTDDPRPMLWRLPRTIRRSCPMLRRCFEHDGDPVRCYGGRLEQHGDPAPCYGGRPERYEDPRPMLRRSPRTIRRSPPDVTEVASNVTEIPPDVMEIAWNVTEIPVGERYGAPGDDIARLQAEQPRMRQADRANRTARSPRGSRGRVPPG
jgi:hypothetical protein